MQRLKDYAGFGVWFLGLGYILMWTFAGPLNWPFDRLPGETAGRFCGGQAGGWLPGLCALAHPQTLSPPVHLVGLLAAITVLVRLLLIALRKPASSSAATAPGSPSRGWRRPEPTVKKIKSRDHFGLRGLRR
jgi:predicted lipid-binding transport protein (Tim44 family)